MSMALMPFLVVRRGGILMILGQDSDKDGNLVGVALDLGFMVSRHI